MTTISAGNYNYSGSMLMRLTVVPPSSVWDVKEAQVTPERYIPVRTLSKVTDVSREAVPMNDEEVSVVNFLERRIEGIKIAAVGLVSGLLVSAALLFGGEDATVQSVPAVSASVEEVAR